MRATLRAFRLAVRLQRLEVLLLIGGGVVLAVACLVIAWQTRVVRADELACYANAAPLAEGSFGRPCPQFDGPRQLLTNLSFAAGAGGLFAPIAMGLFLGIPVVAREVEGGTAPIAWSLARSRRSWLLWRGLPIVTLVVLAATLVGLGEEVMTRSAPWLEGVDASFDFYGARGPLVPLRALAALSLGMALGALVPRQLPALLLAGAVALAFVIAFGLVTSRWMEEAAVPLSAAEAGNVSRVYDSGFREDATARVVGWDEFMNEHPEAFEHQDGPDLPGWTPVMWVVPGSAYDTFVARESAIMLAAAALGMGLTALVVTRRRP
jgi:hypothetical protein